MITCLAACDAILQKLSHPSSPFISSLTSISIISHSE